VVYDHGGGNSSLCPGNHGMDLDMIRSSRKRTGTGRLVIASKQIILFSLQFLVAAGLSAQERSVSLSPVEKILIRSTEAREDMEPGIIHFNGDFYLEASDWNVSADQATLYGNLDDPETVVLTGSPARITVTAEYGGKNDEINGQAASITYRRDEKLIQMDGDARLSRSGNFLRGGSIDYDIENDSLRAGGEGGVRIVVPTTK
jgi:lipopolysaccharide export system protein LptA